MFIYCDASFNEQTKQAGLGVIVHQLLDKGKMVTKMQSVCVCEDNNVAELKAIEFALKNVKKQFPEEPIYIVTDSFLAIDSIYNPEVKKPKYKILGNKIKHMLNSLSENSWQVVHRKAHTKRKDKYSLNQQESDKLARQIRNECGR